MIFDLTWRTRSGWRKLPAFAGWAAGTLVFYGGGLLLTPIVALTAFFASPWPWWAVALLVLPNMAAPMLIVLGGEGLVSLNGRRWWIALLAVALGATVTAADIAALAPPCC